MGHIKLDRDGLIRNRATRLVRYGVDRASAINTLVTMDPDDQKAFVTSFIASGPKRRQDLMKRFR